MVINLLLLKNLKSNFVEKIPMPEKILKCVHCDYVFPIHIHDVSQEIKCLFCNQTGNIEDFEDTHQIDYGVGYTRTFEEFKSVLKNAKKENLQDFFHYFVRSFL